MFYPGLVSVSFRKLSPEELVPAAVAAGLKYIEWGSDVHAPYMDIQRLQEIVQLQTTHGVNCCSYGTYFRLGVTPMEELPGYIRAAKMLGTNILRLWAGNKSPWNFTKDEKEMFFAQCCEAAKLAESVGVTLCMECHRNTYTETKESALELMTMVNSPAFRMYWQPNAQCTAEENVAYARLLRDYTYHIHAYHQKGTVKYSLGHGINDWKTYLQEFPGDHYILLEFMPDGLVETLPREADALRMIVKEN